MPRCLAGALILARSMTLIMLGVALLTSSACTSRDLFFNGGGTLGEAVLQERGVSGATSDYKLRLAINNAWLQSSVELFRRANLLVSRGDVVIVGRVPDALTKLQAGQLAQEAGALSVHNALTVGPDLSWETFLQDQIISNQLEMSLTFDSDVSALNYQILTRDGIVYLAGEARDGEEFDRVHALAADVPNVRKVESYVHGPNL